jgi:hypothetical protein
MLTVDQIQKLGHTGSAEEIQSEIDRWEEAKKNAPTKADVYAAYEVQEFARKAMDAAKGTPQERLAAKNLWDAVADVDAKLEHFRFALNGPEFVVRVSPSL